MKSTLKIVCALLASPGIVWLKFASSKPSRNSTAAESGRFTKRSHFSEPPVPKVTRKFENRTLPRQFDVQRPIAFVHIGKNAGTSMDFVFAKARSMLHFQYVGRKHFDLSYARKKLPTAQESFERF